MYAIKIRVNTTKNGLRATPNTHVHVHHNHGPKIT